MHGDFLGFAAMPMKQPMEYGACGEATLLRREEGAH
jgi:hypothetical protein